MKRAMLATVLFALGLTACGGSPAAPAPTSSALAPEPQAVQVPPSERATALAGAQTKAAVEQATEVAKPAATGSVTTTAQAGQTAAAETSTPDPTIEALARNFKLPELGDPNAPLKIYEFSDYL